MATSVSGWGGGGGGRGGGGGGGHAPAHWILFSQNTTGKCPDVLLEKPRSQLQTVATSQQKILFRCRRRSWNISWCGFLLTDVKNSVSNCVCSLGSQLAYMSRPPPADMKVSSQTCNQNVMWHKLQKGWHLMRGERIYPGVCDWRHYDNTMGRKCDKLSTMCSSESCFFIYILPAVIRPSYNSIPLPIFRLEHGGLQGFEIEYVCIWFYTCLRKFSAVWVI